MRQEVSLSSFGNFINLGLEIPKINFIGHQRFSWRLKFIYDFNLLVPRQDDRWGHVQRELQQPKLTPKANSACICTRQKSTLAHTATTKSRLQSIYIIYIRYSLEGHLHVPNCADKCDSAWGNGGTCARSGMTWRLSIWIQEQWGYRARRRWSTKIRFISQT